LFSYFVCFKNIGDRVVLLLEKSSTSEVVVSQIGAAKAGITLVTVRPSSKEELATVLAESKSKGISKGYNILLVVKGILEEEYKH
jgi:acyl-CoA synthetase (AMP-forming)/AMP-acid ligase II